MAFYLENVVTFPVDWGPGRVAVYASLWSGGKRVTWNQKESWGTQLGGLWLGTCRGDWDRQQIFEAWVLCLLCILRQLGSAPCNLLLLPNVSCSEIIPKQMWKSSYAQVAPYCINLGTNMSVIGELSVLCGTRVMSRGYFCLSLS